MGELGLRVVRIDCIVLQEHALLIALGVATDDVEKQGLDPYAGSTENAIVAREP